MDWQRFVDVMEQISDLSRKNWTFLFIKGKVEVIYDTNHVRWFDDLQDFLDYIDDLKLI